MFYAGIAGAVVLLSLGDSFNANLFAYLFGSILTVNSGDVWVVVVLGGVILVAVATLGRTLFAVVQDEDWARVAGLPVDALNMALTALAAVTVVAAMRVVGILLVAALMIVPVASAQLLARSLRGTMLLSSLIGVTSVVAGLVAARQWALAPGGSIVLVAVGIFLVSSLASLPGVRRRGSARRGPIAPRRPSLPDGLVK
jgi:zinc transport system permease protein